MSHLPTQEQFSQKMKEAYKMLGSCKSVEDISSKDGPLSHMFKDCIQTALPRW